MYSSTVETLGAGKVILNVFSKKLPMITKAALFDQKYSKTVIMWKYYYNLRYFFFLFKYILSVNYSCDGKAEFSAAITPVFSVTWSFRNHSDLLTWCSLTFLIILNVENNTLLNILLTIMWAEILRSHG